MASYLQIENISKSYGPKVLFEHIGFNINEGDKIALIAPNGTGKTSLMRILAGKDKSDSGGKILFLKDIRIAFLEQEYEFEPENDIFTQIMSSSTEFTSHLDQEHLWEYELRVKQFLTNFNLPDFSRKMKELSGGEIKRVALSQMLSTEADFFIMDEPTNHLDIEAIEYLEGFLSRSRCTLLMVTHDRYFLDKVCNTVMEMDRGSVYTYKGDYMNYLEKREERIANHNAETDKYRNLFRRELEWMHSTPCARSGKARYRINAFYELKDKASDNYVRKQVSLDGLQSTSRLGTKIINCKDVCFHYKGHCYLDHFTYNFQRGEKVGIVGPNGSGKSSFINILTGAMAEYPGCEVSGDVQRGESLKIGYYRQEGMSFNEDDTVLDVVNDTRLLGRFLFGHDMFNNRISKLSGGEKRRLYLLTILMQNPNVLILDEPTNDLDIVTLNVLEEYLKEFQGTLLIVSHDRHFLDRLVDHLFVFAPNGQVRDFVGIYSEYRAYLREQQSSARKTAAVKPDTSKSKNAAQEKPKPSQPKKLSWKEQREMEALESEIAALNEEKTSLETLLSGSSSDIQAIQKASVRIGEVTSLLDEKEMRWLELSCR